MQAIAYLQPYSTTTPMPILASNIPLVLKLLNQYLSQTKLLESSMLSSEEHPKKSSKLSKGWKNLSLWART